MTNKSIVLCITNNGIHRCNRQIAKGDGYAGSLGHLCVDCGEGFQE